MTFKVRTNKASISAKIKKAIEGSEEEVREKLLEIAEDLANQTVKFNDTNSYASSFSVDNAGGRFNRRVSSQDRPRRQDAVAGRNIALSNMASDIANLDLKDTRVLFKNGAPHGKFVENKYQVFGTTRDRFR